MWFLQMEFTLTAWKEEYVTAVAKHANNKKIEKNLRNAFPNGHYYLALHVMADT